MQVKGATRSIAVYEVLDGENAVEQMLKLATATDLTRGQELYGAGLYAESAVHFDRVLKQNPNDTVARLYLRRAALAMLNGPPDAASQETLVNSGVWVALSDAELEP